MHLPFPRHDRTQFIRISVSLCRGCGICNEACPNDVLGMTPFQRHHHVHVDHPAQCRGCAKCVRACPQEAILYLKHEPVSVK